MDFIPLVQSQPPNFPIPWNEDAFSVSILSDPPLPQNMVIYFCWWNIEVNSKRVGLNCLAIHLSLHSNPMTLNTCAVVGASIFSYNHRCLSRWWLGVSEVGRERIYASNANNVLYVCCCFC